MAIYLKYDGIPGNVTADGYQGHINIKSCGFKVKRKVTMTPGTLNNREISRPIISEMLLLKDTDSSATEFFKQSLCNATGKQAVIKFVHTRTDKIHEYMEYTLEDCLISRYAITASIYAPPSEVILLSFAKIIINYQQHDATNRAGTPQRVGYDLELAKAI